MKTVSFAVLVAAALALAHAGLTAADASKLRHVASVYFDEKGVGLKLPEGVACDANGQLVVADTGNDRLVRFTYREKALSGGIEIKAPELSAPSTIQLTSKGDIYALDRNRRRIVRLTQDGAFKGALSFDGLPTPAAVIPKSFALDTADNVYVLDALSARILVLNASGQFQRAVPLPEDSGFVSDVTVDIAGNILVLDAVRRRVLSAARDAATFEPLARDLTSAVISMPTYMTIGGGLIYIVEGSGSSIVTLARDGTFLARQLGEGWADGTLNHPAQLCLNGKGDVFIADRDNARVQVFGLLR